MTEMLTGAQLMCRVLLEEGVDVMFGYPGGAIMPFYHALPEFPGLRHILVRHEQAAAHAADGYARASGRAGVCVATHHGTRYLPGNGDHRRIVHVCRGQAGNEIGGPRP